MMMVAITKGDAAGAQRLMIRHNGQTYELNVDDDDPSYIVFRNHGGMSLDIEPIAVNTIRLRTRKP